MKAHLFACLCVFFVLSTSVFGQRSKVRELALVMGKTQKVQTSGDIVVLPKFEVVPEPYLSEKVFYELSLRYNPIPKNLGVVAVESDFSKTSLRHGLEESPVFEFGLRGKELKALKGGFEIGSMDFYLKKGIAWHPRNDRYVTWTIGKRSTWGYAFHNEHDLGTQLIRNPIMFLNDKIFERPVYTLMNRLGW